MIPGSLSQPFRASASPLSAVLRIARGEALRRLDEPRVLEPLEELVAVDRVEPDLHGRVAGVVRAREVDVGVRIEDQLLLLAVDPHGEPAAVPLARLPREELPPDAPRRAALERLLDLREVADELADRLEIGHARVQA